MTSRFLVPRDAKISSVEPVAAGVRHDLLARKRLVPAGAHLSAVSREQVVSVERNLMVPKRLIPANAGAGAAACFDFTSAHATPQAVFAEALLEKVSLGKRNKPAEWLLSFAIHAILLAVLLMIPLFYAQVIDLNKFDVVYLAAPPALGAPAPPAPPAAMVRQPITRKTNLRPGKLMMPVAVPKVVQMQSVPEAAPEIAAVTGGVIGGIPGGEVGGVFGGVLNAEPVAPSAPAVVPAAAPSGPVRVGGNVKSPRALYKPGPEYPRVARIARVQGVVEIDAIIDSAGNVVGAKAMSGHPLLLQAALQAVKQWKYEPTYLNGVPCSVELMVEVTFALS